MGTEEAAAYEPRASWDPLNPPDPISGDPDLAERIGRVALADVWVEMRLRSLWHALVGFGHRVSSIVPNNFTALIDDCRELVDAPAGVTEDEFDERYREAVRSTLTEAAEAHRLRNRVLHDLWINDGEGGFRTLQLRKGMLYPPAAAVQTREEATDVEYALRRVVLRVSHAMNEPMPEITERWSEQNASANCGWSKVSSISLPATTTRCSRSA